MSSSGLCHRSGSHKLDLAGLVLLRGQPVRLPVQLDNARSKRCNTCARQSSVQLANARSNSPTLGPTRQRLARFNALQAARKSDMNNRVTPAAVHPKIDFMKSWDFSMARA